MILDERTEFADALTLTVTAISDVIDLYAGQNSPVLRNLGGGNEPLWLVITVDTAFTAGGAATATFTLESDSTADLATSATVHASTAAIAVATMTAGATLACIALPSGLYERYLGVRATIATGPMLTGKYNAFLVNDPSKWRAYPDNVA